MANEKRLIDANALKVKGFADHDTGEGIVFVQDIDEAPTVDAVPVVYCKDCQSSHYNECSGLTKCTSQRGLHRIVDPNEHCSWGERKADEP